MTTLQPWNDYPASVGYKPDPSNSRHLIWDTANFPFVVRWDTAASDRLTHWRTHTREFSTLEDAVAAYKRPFRGLSVDLVKYNGGPPGRHLSMLARRKPRGPTQWADDVPADLRG